LDRLLYELTADGTLDTAGAQWARAYQGEHGGELDSALLELDLVPEAALLKALEACTGLAAARPADLERADPTVGKRLPEGFSKSFSMCPVWLEGSQLAALVQSPLPAGWVQELRELFGLEVSQLVAPSHYLAVARQKVYGTAACDRTQELESRLARRRRGADVSEVLAKLAGAATLGAAVAAVLDFAERLTDACCFLVPVRAGLQVAACRGGPRAGATIPLPDPSCALGPAILHGGYFFGPVAGTEADRQLFGALGRAVPARAFVAPVPAAGGGMVSFCADNGPRGMAMRWVAELSLLVARLGGQSGDWQELGPEPVPGLLRTDPRPESAPAPSKPPPPEPAQPVVASVQPPPPPALEARESLAESPADGQSATPHPTAVELAILQRLRRAATDAGMPLDAFVAELLQARPLAPRPDATAAMVAEVKELFDRLATDIPTHLARGMESAFRDLVPRLGGVPSASGTTPAAAAGVELVVKEAAPREVASYRACRKKSTRIKL
jgi:hypothetical protein